MNIIKNTSVFVQLKMRFFHVAIAIASISAATVTVIYPSVTDGIREGLVICASMLIPSLFPFMVLGDLLTQINFCNTVSRMFSFIFRHLFGKGENIKLGGIFIMSVIGGYPIGSRCAQTLYEKGDISSSTAAKAVCFCVNSSPAFLITAVGKMLYQSTKTGIALFLCSLLGSLVCGMIFARLPIKSASSSGNSLPFKSEIEPSNGIGDIFVDSVTTACKGMLSLCGFVVIICGFSRLLNETAFPEYVRAIFHGILEVSAGGPQVVKNGFSLPAAAAIFAFAGFCVHLQCRFTAKKVFPNFFVFLSSRLLHSFFSGLFMYLYCIYSPDVASAAAIKLAVTPVFETNPMIAVMAVLSIIMTLPKFKKDNILNV